MKTLLTVALTVFNVTFGVNVACANSKTQEAATFAVVDNRNAATYFLDEQEACAFNLLSSTANTTDEIEACTFSPSSSTANATDEGTTFIFSDRSLAFLNGLYEKYTDEK